MSFLNLNYQFVIAEDYKDSKNPKVRTPDITVDVQQACVASESSKKFTIYPNEIVDISVTARNVLWASSTELEFSRYLSTLDNIRIQWTGTGTNPAFRTKRVLGGDATTQVTITRLTPYVARISSTGGTAWSTSGIQTGDMIKFEKNTDTFTSPFTDFLLGQTFLVQTAGTTYVDFIDNGLIALAVPATLGADFDFAVRVMSAGPVKINDQIELTGTNYHPSNRGIFTIVDVSPEYIEIINPLGLEETVTYGTTSAVIYDRLIGFLHVRAPGAPGFKLRFGNQTEWTSVSRLGSECIFMTSVSTFKVQATNTGLDAIELSVQDASVLG